jgi:predicted transcriptional regulator
MSLTKRKKAALELDLQGYSGKKIAEEIGITQQCLSKWRAEEEYKQEYEKRTAETIQCATDKIRNYTSLAIDRLFELSQSKNERVALGAVNSIIDRGIGRAKETVSIQADVQQRPLQNISNEQLEKLINDEQ